MHVFQGKGGRYFILLPDVWAHIIDGHPEMGNHLKEIGGTLANPEVIRKSKKNEDRHLFYRRFRNKLFFVVVVDAVKGIIKTSYLTDKIKEGEIIWQEKK